ncbi:hypothetical protein I5E68_15350 [Novosphingobium sp. YJ-S2-02]|uniref:Uncharacterized protein n=1 Tax=Novosphingobium aureum TaxID=2792964 RepID=A0A931HFC2_9SPHN|nr:hypothetical protein [Novosphingobium aureum]MBH0114321.1 hypothetical protein [Novosphingobium aureum]
MQKVLYGDCTGGPASTSVRICELDGESCSFEADAAPSASRDMLNGPLTLWIGAVGPFHATATHTGATPAGASRYLARFVEPLDTAIVRHFSSI